VARDRGERRPSLRSTSSGCVLRVAGADDADSHAAAAARSAETERYTAAGAFVSHLVHLPDDPASSVWDAFDACDDSLFGCDVILIEGGPSIGRDVDSVVFVTPPLADGETLLVEETREVDRIDGRDALLLMLGIDPSDITDEPAEFDDDAVEEEVIETFELSDEASAAINRLLDHGMPVTHAGPWLQPGFEGLASAELAVVDARAEHDAHTARRLIETIKRRWP
jgi:hypothetical protein